MTDHPSTLKQLQADWQSHWQAALCAWSRFTQLSEPRWCFTVDEESKEQLGESFAMIRLTDHAVVISLRKIRAQKLDVFATEILAHEIGHHVYAPADLRDNARLQARIRAGLPTRETFSAMIANLYTDLLINDRLQRSANIRIANVYKALQVENADPLWKLYMRIYEVLWRLAPGTLAPANTSAKINVDADLGARVIRAYSAQWLAGAGRFAALFLPYLLEIPDVKVVRLRLPPWFDTESAGAGDEIPDGLIELDDDELDGAIHPAEDEALSGLGHESSADHPIDSDARTTQGGQKNKYRTPEEYRDLMKSIRVTIPEKDLVIKYYRECALPHIIRFPTRVISRAGDPIPEGVDTWDIGDPLVDIDWPETMSRGPQVIPGVTTVQRTYDSTDGDTPKFEPPDLYIGIDCSGSMSNPAQSLSYPVLAGAIVAISALRTGASVMACLSGEPGKFSQTTGFIRKEHQILGILTGYLGTGYAYGIMRLKATFLDDAAPPLRRPAHLLIISDSDIFYMLKECRNGWEIAEKALRRAGGGGTFALQLQPGDAHTEIKRLQAMGWNVHPVRNQEELIAFAAAFSRATYEAKTGTPIR